MSDSSASSSSVPATPAPETASHSMPPQYAGLQYFLQPNGNQSNNWGSASSEMPGSAISGSLLSQQSHLQANPAAQNQFYPGQSMNAPYYQPQALPAAQLTLPQGLNVPQSGFGVNEVAWKLIQERIGALEENMTRTSELEKKMAAERERTNLLEARMNELESARAPSSGKSPRGKQGSRVPRDTAIEDLVHRKVQGALGIRYVGRGATIELPDPLPEGASHRADDHGNRLWNPDWTKGFRDPLNAAFISHVVQVLEDDERGLEQDKWVFLRLTESARREKVKTYFENLSGRYKAREEDSPAAQKLQVRKKGNSRAQRLKRQAATLRELVGPVEEKLAARFGKENVQGLTELIHTDWIDSCHSDVGEASREEWVEQKKASGLAGTTAWEARRRVWVSGKVRRVHQLLRKEKRDGDSGKTMLHGTPIFPGLRVNNNDRPPPMDKPESRPWRNAVSKKWMRRTKHETLPFKNADPAITVLNLDIPDDMFDPEDLLFLADDEASDNEGGEDTE